MHKYIIKFTLIFLLIASFTSCMDSDYKLSNIDKEGILNIPPVPLGILDSLHIKGLPQLPSIPELEIPLEGRELILKHTFKGLFGNKVVKDFFFDGAKDASIYCKADVHTSLKNLNIALRFYVLDKDSVSLENVQIPVINIKNKQDQEIELIIQEEQMKYMKGAKHLLLYMVMTADKLDLYEEDLIVFKEAILKPGGYHVNP